MAGDQFPTCYGTEFTSSAVLAFTQAARLDRRYIAPGKPAEDAFAESFQGTDARRMPQRVTCSSR